MINVTEPFLPKREEYEKYIDQIWSRKWLTNNGPLVNELELQLKDYLQLDHLLYLTNGTIAIQLAIKVLELQGEIITTPFSFVATTSSIVWEHCKPVFVDIDEETLNLDPRKIEGAITEKTTAILATHVYGNPCDIDAIAKIAARHKLKVIYDAAHCFGTKYKGKSVLTYGDVSTISFHATKLYHTTEGGAVVTPSAELLKKMSLLRNFGFNGPYTFASVGINGKNSEFHAAMGLANLPYANDILRKRREDSLQYDDMLLGKIPVRRPKITDGSVYNYSYYTLVFETEEQLLKVHKSLEVNGIFTRRYFYPSLTTLPYVKASEVLVTVDVAARVLCLPLYYSLNKAEIDMISRYILRTLKYG
ncbi:DegT/DnrJ/EryC1/StrS aminotransferase family protein [Cesiribacter sp. SM1]|uniref:DegT/DnrJ/EryC1/StrS family aminotransferase n=1 Tax=Cesiribacter sp. SM1 TaxID=2861196 RepID=UPI001CD4A31F|nr:DegT/DnrJ/EryC1/StrS family aminotransferase [Cesiribacter sp. SM1]